MTADKTRRTAQKSPRKAPQKAARKSAGKTTGTAGRESADQAHDSESSTRATAPRAESRPRKSALAVAQRATDELTHLVGKPVEGVTGVDRTDAGWVVQVEVLELRRVPETTDVLGLYEIETDDQGSLLGYRRVARYSRSESRGEES